MKSTSPPTIREQLHTAAQLECWTIAQAALVVNVSQDTIRRRLPSLKPEDVARSGRIVRVRRLAILKLFGLTRRDSAS